VGYKSGKIMAKTSAASSASTVKSVYALVGSDAFVQTEKLRQIMAGLPEDAARIDVDGERAELADVLDELRSFAMFGGGKVVVVSAADEFISRFREQLENYCEHPSNSATLVLRCESLPKNQRIYKIIQKNGQIEACDPPNVRELPGWIVQRARSAHGLAVTGDAAAMLAELIGNDLGRLDNELAKLALQCEGGKADVKDVAGSVAFQREQEMWAMTDEVAAGRTSAALCRWRQLVQADKSAEFRAVTWLGMWLEKAIKALELSRRGMNPFGIAKELRIWPAEKGAALVKTSQRMGEAGLRRALNLLVEVDHQSKTGVGEAAENIERFILAVGGTVKA
jgi:DNA polymerase-3 subunit delta